MISDKLTFHEKVQYLLGVLEGEYTAEDFAMFSQRFAGAVTRFDGHRVLLDKTRFLNHFDYHDAVLFC